jgi:hypothetical protein
LRDSGVIDPSIAHMVTVGEKRRARKYAQKHKRRS